MAEKWRWKVIGFGVSVRRNLRFKKIFVSVGEARESWRVEGEKVALIRMVGLIVTSSKLDMPTVNTNLLRTV